MNEKSKSDYEVVNHSSCSRCLAVETCVSPLAWTLSTLRQTSHESPRPLRSSRSENIVKQQVPVNCYVNIEFFK